MINIHNHSDTAVIVVHEIYGINHHMKHICKLLSEKNVDVICPNLLNQEEPFEYVQEEVAYQNFIENVGFLNASDKIKRIVGEIRDNYKKIYIVGFSVGATIAWLCSEEKGLDGMVGYYGSRIRNYVEICPLCPVMLFFPEKEPSFNVDELITYLEEKNIEIHKCKGQHGFSDPYSQRYNATSAKEAFNKTVDFFQNTGSQY
ncbi:dienelactone hydrolase family protein [Neobacillus sp. 19]|uniref:dienelactone hydrolase family protein n=1 Tax=Neobacillus sp. 19 TaxID=3394458 RepID=UPI003BF6C175